MMKFPIVEGWFPKFSFTFIDYDTLKDLSKEEDFEREIITKIRFIKCKDLLNSDLVGIWKDRTDITDTVEFVNSIRSRILRQP